MAIHTSEMRVQWFETDRADVVYFGNYFHFFTAAEDDFFRFIDLSYTSMKESFNIGFARIYAECHFKRPARYEDLIQVELEPWIEDPVHILFIFRIYRKEGHLLLAEGKVRVACVDMGEKFRVIRMPKEVFDKLHKALEEPA